MPRRDSEKNPVRSPRRPKARAKGLGLTDGCARAAGVDGPVAAHGGAGLFHRPGGRPCQRDGPAAVERPRPVRVRRRRRRRRERLRHGREPLLRPVGPPERLQVHPRLHVVRNHCGLGTGQRAALLVSMK